MDYLLTDPWAAVITLRPWPMTQTPRSTLTTDRLHLWKWRTPKLHWHKPATQCDRGYLAEGSLNQKVTLKSKFDGTDWQTERTEQAKWREYGVFMTYPSRCVVNTKSAHGLSSSRWCVFVCSDGASRDRSITWLTGRLRWFSDRNFEKKLKKKLQNVEIIS